MVYTFVLLGAYLMGSIPMGLLLTWATGHGDLRKVGSGNIGATNVLRVGGLRLAIIAWLLDMAKVVGAYFLGKYLLGDMWAAWCGAVALIGHCFPIWLKFKGGKGISCLFGLMLVANPLIFVFSGLEWLIVALTCGYSSLAAIVTFTVTPIFAFVLNADIGWPFLAVAVLCLVRHHENIARLINGTESKIGWKWKK